MLCMMGRIVSLWIGILLTTGAACLIAGCSSDPENDGSPDADGDADADADADHESDADPDGEAGDGDVEGDADEDLDIDEDPPDYPSPSVEAQMPFWTVLVPVKLNELEPLSFLLDTGSDRMLVSKNLSAEIESGTVDQFVFAGRTYEDVPCKTHDLAAASALLGVEVGGILGYELLKRAVVGIDYRRQVVYHLDDWGDEADFGPEVAGPFSALAFDLNPAKIIVISARFEDMDEEVDVILDTGTSSTVISQSLVDALGAEDDGRTVLRGSKSVSPLGEMDTPIIRLRSLGIGDRESVHTWATIHPDSYFALIGRVIGVEVEAIVGGGFLREFLVGIDYEAATLYLAPYTTLDHIEDEFQMVGIEVIAGDAGFEVYTVFEESDAEAQGIAVGDLLLELDGAPAVDMTPAEVVETLRGEVGTTLEMRLRNDTGEYDVEVLREDLLPDL